jgi:hypothetical protein
VRDHKERAGAACAALRGDATRREGRRREGEEGDDEHRAGTARGGRRNATVRRTGVGAGWAVLLQCRGGGYAGPARAGNGLVGSAPRGAADGGGNDLASLPVRRPCPRGRLPWEAPCPLLQARPTVLFGCHGMQYPPLLIRGTMKRLCPLEI